MAGLIERRGTGLLSVAHEPSAVVRLAIELSGRNQNWPRMPEAPPTLSLSGINVPRMMINSSESAADQALLVADCVERMSFCSWEGKRIPLEQCAAVHKNRRVAASPPVYDERTVD